MATEFVLDKFASSCIDESSQELMQEIKKIVIARKHKAFQPDTNAHRQFLSAHLKKRIATGEISFPGSSNELSYFHG